jgi:hypothetical protein
VAWVNHEGRGEPESMLALHGSCGLGAPTAAAAATASAAVAAKRVLIKLVTDASATVLMGHRN